MSLLEQLRQSAAAQLGVAGAAGYGVDASRVDSVYYTLTAQAANALDLLATGNIRSDWANALLNAENKGTFAPASHTGGYFTSQQFADFWYFSTYYASHGGTSAVVPLNADGTIKATEAPLTVIQPEHVAAGLVPLTEAERAAYDAALASGEGVRPDGSVGLSFQLSAAAAPAPVPVSSVPLSDTISRPVGALLLIEPVAAGVTLLDDLTPPPPAGGFVPDVLPVGAKLESAPKPNASSSSGWVLAGIAVVALLAGFASSQRPRS